MGKVPWYQEKNLTMEIHMNSKRVNIWIFKVTKNDNISSVHIDSIQNPLMLFSLLKTILEDNADIFSKQTSKI